MDFSLKADKDVCLLYFDGRLTFDFSKQISAYLHSLSKDKVFRGFIFNLQNTDTLDSSGLGVIVTFYKELQTQNRKLLLCHLNEEILEVLAYTHMDKIMEVYPSEKEALAAL